MLTKRAMIAMVPLLVLLALEGASAWAAADLEEGVKDLAEKITKSMIEKGTHKIAIIDFSDLNGNVTALGQFMAEELTTQLFMLAPGKFEVVERRQLLKLEEELMLGQEGFIEEKSLKKMGQVLGVEAIVTGSMTDLGNTVKINARMIAVESAKVFAVAATSIPKTGIVADLASKAAERRTVAGAQTPTAAQQAQPKAGKELVAENEFLRVTARPLKKQGKGATLVIVYENIGEHPFRMGYQFNGTYLLDEDGNRWNFQSETANVTNYVELIPKTKLQNRITFQPTGDSGGHIFSLVSGVLFPQMWVNGQMYPPSGQATITVNDIPAE